MEPRQTMNVLEACLLAAGRPLRIAELEALFNGDDGVRPDRAAIRQALAALGESLEGRGVELVEVAGGWRLQTRAAMAPWVARLFEERPPRYSRALLETLVLIAYRQPITRGEIEAIRGVAVSSTIVKTLQERRWIREVGHKDVPGRPALLGTTAEFLSYFNLRRLEDLPPLEALKDLDSLEAALAAEIGVVDAASEAANDAAPDALAAPPAPNVGSDVAAPTVTAGESVTADDATGGSDRDDDGASADAADAERADPEKASSVAEEAVAEATKRRDAAVRPALRVVGSRRLVPERRVGEAARADAEAPVPEVPEREP